MAPPFVLDVSGIESQLAAIINNAIAFACEQVHAVVAESREQNVAPAKEPDINGMRQLILDNASLLLPIVRPDLSWELHLPGNAANAARLQVVTHGTVPFIKASVMFGRPACISKTTIVESAPAMTPAEALTKLLNATMELVAMHAKFLEDSCTELNIATVSVDGGSLYKRSPKTSPLASDDEMWWGNSKSKKTSPSIKMSGPSPEVNIRHMMEEFQKRDAKVDIERGSHPSLSSNMHGVSFTITEALRGSGK